MTEPPIICTLSAEGLRGYAAGVRAARAIAARATLFSLPAAVQQMDSEAAIAEGFAARLEEAALPEDLQPTLYLPPGWATADGTPDLHDALLDAGAALLEPAEMCSTEWDGTRWAVRVPIGDGDTDIEWFDTQEEAQAFCDDATAAAQDAIDAAATPQATPQPEADAALPPAAAINIRSISDLTEAEALDLEKRYRAGVESIDGISRALRISPNSVRSRATYRHWFRVHVGPQEADNPSPARAPTAASSPFVTPPAAHAKAPPPPPAPMTTEDKAEARERLRTGASKGALDIIEWFGCTADEAQALVDAHRAKGGK